MVPTLLTLMHETLHFHYSSHCYSFYIGGVDYELNPTVLIFPAGSAQGARQCVTVSINDDVAVENNEHFHMTLTSSDARFEVSSICPRAVFRIFDVDGK